MKHLATLLFLLLVGCHANPITPSPHPAPAVTADAERAVERSRIDERDSQAVSAATTWLGLADRMTPEAWRSEFSLFLKRYAHVQPRPEHVAAAKARVQAWVDGRVDEAKAITLVDEQEASVQAGAVLASRSAREAAERAELASRAESKREIERLRTQLENERNRVMREQVRDLNYAAAGFTAAAAVATGLAWFFGGVLALRKVAPFAGLLFALGLMCFGLAQLVAQLWFKWAVAAVIGIALAWLAVWAVRHYKQGNLKEEAERRAAKLKAALGDVVPVLDKAYDDANATVRDLLDDTIFSKLSTKMDRETKQTIHELRAETPGASSP